MNTLTTLAHARNRSRFRAVGDEQMIEREDTAVKRRAQTPRPSPVMTMSGNGEPSGRITGGRPVEIPIRIGATDVRRHLTGSCALNIPNAPLLHGGDWHQCCGWFTEEPHDLRESAYTNEREHGRLLDRLGGIGLRDARAGLRRLAHPAGDGATKVWAATYDRAVLETAWAYLQKYGPGDMIEGYKPIDTRELARWLPHPHQWLRLHALAWLLRNDLKSEVLAKWDNWRHSWSPRA